MEQCSMFLQKKIYKRLKGIMICLSMFVAILIYTFLGMLEPITGLSGQKSFAREVAKSTVSMNNVHYHDQSSGFHMSSRVTSTAPDASLTLSLAGDSTYDVGDSVTYDLDVATSADGGDIEGQTPLIVTDSVPAGFNNLSTVATDWNVQFDNTTSPATMTATYTGTTPIAAGSSLPTIILTGTLTDQAASNLNNAATLTLQGDSDPTNNTSSVAIQVNPDDTSTPTTTPIPGSTPTVTSGSGPDLAMSLVDDSTGCTNIGDQVTYTATVTNGTDAGQVAVGQPITVTVTLPDGSSDVALDGGTDWQISTAGTTVMASYMGSYPVDLGTMLTPITITTTMQTPSTMNPTGSAIVTTPQDANESAETTDDALTICAPDLTINTSHEGMDTSQVGQPVSYTLSVSNGTLAGPVIEGQAITVTDMVPPGISQMTSAGDGWQFTTTPSSDTTMVTATYTGDYPVLTGASLPDITISGVLTSAAVPMVINNTTVSTPLDSDTSDNASSDTLSVEPLSDLTLSLKHAGNTCISVGKMVIWIISVKDGENAGSVFGGPLIATDTLPDGLSNIKVVGKDWSSKNSGTTVTATYTGAYPINPGAILSSITVTGTVSSASSSTLLNTASVSGPGDSNSGNNTMSDLVAVCHQPVALPDLGISFTHVSANCINIGDQVAYTVTVTNGKKGPIPLGQPIIVTVMLAAGLSNIVPDGETNWQLTTNGTVVTANYTGSYPVAVGSTLQPITINAKMQMPISIHPTGSATVKTLQDSNLANNTAKDVLNICPPRIVTRKTHPAGQRFRVGQQVVYTISLSNAEGAGPVLVEQSLLDIDTTHGVKQVKATGRNWQFIITSSRDVTTVIAKYKGQYPVVAGESLPVITIRAILTVPSLPVLSSTELVKAASKYIKVIKPPHRTVLAGVIRTLTVGAILHIRGLNYAIWKAS